MGQLDPLRARLQRRDAQSSESPEVMPLVSADVRELRLPWLSRFSAETLHEHLERNPGKAMWVPRTGEYIVAERWRHRDDIANIVEVTARKGRQSLLQELLTVIQGVGCRLVLLSDDIWNDQPHFYSDFGFAALERIVFFQRSLKQSAAVEVHGQLPRLQYQIAVQDDLGLLINLDHDSFPWLWWNSEEDMEIYVGMDCVSVYIARTGGEGPGADLHPVGYAAFTMYNGWAHLDRLAVASSLQGRKYGAAQLVNAMQEMVALGANYVGLSTQENNIQSHRLYTGFGFRQTRDYMNIYGKWLQG